MFATQESLGVSRPECAVCRDTPGVLLNCEREVEAGGTDGTDGRKGRMGWGNAERPWEPKFRRAVQMKLGERDD